MDQLANEINAKLDELAHVFNDFNEKLSKLIQLGRCTALCQTKLQEAYFWAMQSFTDPTTQAQAQQQISPILKPGPAVNSVLQNKN